MCESCRTGNNSNCVLFFLSFPPLCIHIHAILHFTLMMLTEVLFPPGFNMHFKCMVGLPQGELNFSMGACEEDELSFAALEGGLAPSEAEDSSEHLHCSQKRLSTSLARPPLPCMLCSDPASLPSQSIERSAQEWFQSREDAVTVFSS